MKKVLLISAFVLGMTCMSVGANSFEKTHESGFYDDSGGITKVCKNEMINITCLELRAVAPGDLAFVPSPVEATDRYAVTETKTTKPAIARRIYLLNCTIKQCLWGSLNRSV